MQKFSQYKKFEGVETIMSAEEMEQSGMFDEYQQMMREFARKHVTAALKAAHKNMQLPEEDLEFTLSSYPLTNII